MAITLRDYQQACLSSIRERYLGGTRRQLVCLPTGSGKTVIFSQFPRFFRMKNQMLVLAHREELLEQARDKIERANPLLRVEIEQANRRAAPDCDVVVASVYTLGRRGSARLERLDPQRFHLVVVDEAHHATAETYQRVLKYFGLFEPDSRKLLVGFTATPKRGDGQGLDAVFEDIVFSRTLPEMVLAGYLAPVAGYRVDTTVDLSSVKTRMGDFVTSQLSRVVNIDERNALVVDIYRQYLSERQTLCFCVDVSHAMCLAKSFNEAGIPAASVSGDMPRPARAEALEAFAAGRTRVLANCMVLTEGYDEPSISGIILARPTKSVLLYTQMIGRGTRLHPGKENVTVVDIVDASRQHELTTLPSLFGLSDEFDLEGHTVEEAQKALEWVERKRPWVHAEQALSLSELRYRCEKVDLLDLATPDELLECSRFAWVGLDRGIYRLGLSGSRSIIVAPTILGRYEVTFCQDQKDREIASGAHLAQAILRAENYVEAHLPDVVGLVLRRSRWRRAPASDKQIQVLKRRKIEVPPGLTKGQASHLISMLSEIRPPV